jgi:hypothetical protein
MCLKFNQTASKGETTKPKIKPSSMDKDRAQKVMSLLQKGAENRFINELLELSNILILKGHPKLIIAVKIVSSSVCNNKFQT